MAPHQGVLCPRPIVHTHAPLPCPLPPALCSPAAAPAPDTDKMIGQQLFLDVQEFGRQARQVRRRRRACGARSRASPRVPRACLEVRAAQRSAAPPRPLLRRPPVLPLTLAQAGVDAAALEPYRQLWATVAPEGQAETIAF